MTNYPSVTDAIRPIFMAGPTVIALGEIHKLNPSKILSANRYLSAEIIPLMIEFGYTELVWEFFPSGPQAQVELDEYYRTGSLTGVLATWFSNNPDMDGVTSVLGTLRGLSPGKRPNLHGSHANDPYELLKLEQAEKVAETINERTYAIAKALSLQEKKVITFNGAQHNNSTPLPSQENRTFGNRLRTDLGAKNFIEIDLYILALMEDQPDRLIGIPNWQAHKPLKGINSFTFSNGRIALIIAPNTR